MWESATARATTVHSYPDLSSYTRRPAAKKQKTISPNSTHLDPPDRERGSTHLLPLQQHRNDPIVIVHLTNDR